jgi:hypothetical protein
VLQHHGGHALVEYDELHADEEGAVKLREWFPVPAPLLPAQAQAQSPAQAARAGAGGKGRGRGGAPPPGEFPVHDAPTNVLRPTPPAEARPRALSLALVNGLPWPPGLSGDKGAGRSPRLCLHCGARGCARAGTLLWAHA